MPRANADPGVPIPVLQVVLCLHVNLITISEERCDLSWPHSYIFNEFLLLLLREEPLTGVPEYDRGQIELLPHKFSVFKSSDQLVSALPSELS